MAASRFTLQLPPIQDRNLPAQAAIAGAISRPNTQK